MSRHQQSGRFHVSLCQSQSTANIAMHDSPSRRALPRASRGYFCNQLTVHERIVASPASDRALECR